MNLKKRWKHIRQNWNLHVAQLVHEGYFKNEYRMSFNAWNRLYAILSNKLKRKRIKEQINVSNVCKYNYGNWHEMANRNTYKWC